MSGLLQALMATGATPAVYSDDVFSATIYNGNSANQSIVNGINLASFGGMVWMKHRTSTPAHYLFDTARTLNAPSPSPGLSTQSTNFAVNAVFNSFDSNGFTLGSDTSINSTGNNYISWSFRNAAKFFNVQQVVKSSGSNATVDLSSLGTVGMVKVKRTDAAGSWYIWHRSLTSGKLLVGETTAAEATLGHITVSGTTLTLVNGVIADGTYHVESYAHDTSVNGIIQCGIYTGNGSTSGPPTNLGWEPQYIQIKSRSFAGVNYETFDTSRGLVVGGSLDASLRANLNNAEAITEYLDISATGFVPTISGNSVNANGETYIYMAIRRPNKPVTSGTQVYNAVAQSGNSAARNVTCGFQADTMISGVRGGGFVGQFWDRIRGPLLTLADNTAAETGKASTVTGFDVADGVNLGSDSTFNMINTTGSNYVYWFLKRAPKVFDVVCYNAASAHTEPHNLGVVPELIISKVRSTTASWYTFANMTGSGYLDLSLDSTAAATARTYASNAGLSAQPTATGIPMDSSARLNSTPNTYILYLFATLAGVSKVFSYTGNGTSQTVDCGFAAGARFVMIKRTDSAGHWYVWDSTRGIVAGNDPYVSLISTAGEITTDDSLDPSSVGFIVNQVAANNINVNSATYIGLAFA